MRIYLAGGMRPRQIEHFIGMGITFSHELGQTEIAWADIVMQALDPGVIAFDPRVSNTKEFELYSFLDVMELRRCDVVVAYLEAENPSGMGLAAEIAFAKGLGKTVLLINEKHEDRYVRFIENFADLVYTDLAKGLEAVRKFRP